MKKEVSVEELRSLVVSRINLEEDVTDEILSEVIDGVIEETREKGQIPLEKRLAIHREITDSIRGLDILQELLEDDSITEIMVNGWNDIFIEKKGEIIRVDSGFVTPDRLYEVIQQIVSATNRRVNQATPIVDTRLKDGSRVNVVLSPVSIRGSALTIRKFPKKSITMKELIAYGSISFEVASYLRKLVEARYNIMISGGTSSGKTTFLNALSNFIPGNERIITIEDSAELRLQNIDNLVSLEARRENTDGENEVSIRELIKTSLRMRPDRVIVGEVRGEEALDMLQAMNTGHDGSMSTGHANSAKDILSRIETMVLTSSALPLNAVRGQIASGIDVIVHLGRRRGCRRVLEICEVVDYRDGEYQLNTLFKYEKGEDGYGLFKKNDLINDWKIEVLEDV